MTSAELLDPRQLIAQARQRTGLEAFDELPLLEPLDVLTGALRTEARLTPIGAQVWHQRLLDILMTRLRVQDWCTRHPEILDEQIVAPLVIVGLPRTGTTLLHRLIASDSRFYAAAWWETRFPAPFSADDIGGGERVKTAKLEVAAMLEAVPELAAIHPLDALEADEEIMLLEQTLYSTTPPSMACVPSYAAWQKRQDLRPAYAYLKRLLQLILWQKKRRGLEAQRWVLKAPMHLGYVEVLFETLPDTTLVQTHRDPLSTMPSYASMIYNLWRLGSEASDPIEAGRQWSEIMAEHLHHCMAVRSTLPAERFVDVDFRDTVKDPLGVVERIYRRVGLPMTDLARTRIQAYMREHSREDRAPHNYTLEQFGFTEAGLRERFRAYRERHIEPFA